MPTDKSPTLVGLVLCGGKSSRMGTDKAAIRYQDAPESIRVARLMHGYCSSIAMSVRSSTPIESREYPILHDDTGFEGPLAGIVTALRAFPENALLALACDMPLITEEALNALISGRDPDAEATVCIAADDCPEPLCAIYEPRILDRITRYTDAGGRSPREMLSEAVLRNIRLDDSDALASANTPHQRAQAERCLQGLKRAHS